jgi:hypothetical protein
MIGILKFTKDPKIVVYKTLGAPSDKETLVYPLFLLLFTIHSIYQIDMSLICMCLIHCIR